MMRRYLGFAVIAVLGLVGPFALPTVVSQLAFVWLFVLFALTWDAQGGQMGYNSFGNILYFGIGMYVCTVVIIGLTFNVAEYTAPGGEKAFTFTTQQYAVGLALGTIAGGIVAALVAAVLGSGILGLRGHYFAIGTLGLGIAAGELAAGWEFIGAGSGIAAPVFPDPLGDRATFFYFVFFALAVIAFFVFRRLYRGRFGLAINAIRDDEDKAEAMGLPTTRYKTMSWMVSAFFLGLAGGPFGLLIGFIDPRDTAFAGVTFGVWMVLMAILGGKGTLWGPVLGAVIFLIFKELFWVFLLGWQQVALGALIVIIVVFFPQGLMGWMRERWPEQFGHGVEESTSEGAP
ncbi:MAG: branched-chain amino acid ABC transporter permease [Alphaproteobacteria bacterium]|nr:branched-chain amino acid ABC transporter permease [Alphaproteobacteria bacterium]